jgi:histidinol-phosphate aminotransferase
MKFDLQNLVRPNIRNLVPYSSARKEFARAAEIFLDANENSFGSPSLDANFNRYPDPLQIEIKKILGARLSVSSEQIFVGNGSDEAIDLLLRVFCRPEQDEVIITPPTYGMYEVAAGVNAVRVKKVLLSETFQLNVEAVLQAVGANTKLIFLCSPNNPTGNCLRREAVRQILANFGGIVVVDEAYIHFACEKSFVGELSNFPNLAVLQTFSKAWGLAGLRVGLAFASREIIAFLNKIKPPYNVSEIAQKTLLAALRNKESVEKTIAEIVRERERLRAELQKLSFVRQIYPSQTNFLLVKTVDAKRIYDFLIESRIVVRNRSNVELCENCLRITVGTTTENNRLIETLQKL